MKIQFPIIPTVVMGITVLGYFIVVFAYVFPNFPEDAGILLEISIGFGGVIIVEAVSFFTAQTLENKRHLEAKKEQHTKDLIDQILSRLTKIVLRRDVDNKLYIDLPKKPKNYEEEDDYDYNESDYEPIEKLPQPYWRMTEKHLEEYKDITDFWMDSITFARKHNQLLDRVNEELENRLREMFNQNFPNIKEYKQNDEDGYYLGRLTEDVSHYLYIKSEHLPTEYPEDETEEGKKFSLRDVSEEHNTNKYLIGRYKDPFIICSKKEELNLNKLNELINNVCNDEEIVKQFDQIISLQKQCDHAHTLFGDEMDLLIASLKAGVPLKGKCELGY